MANRTCKVTTDLSSNATLKRCLLELGVLSLHESLLDTKLLVLQRLIRMFAYGGSTLVLVRYLSALGFTDGRIGMFMTLTLLGDVAICLVLTLISDRVGRRCILGVGSLLMAASGFLFATMDDYWILVVAATIGIISPAGNETGPFKAIEESTLSQLTASGDRPRIFAWYAMAGTMGTAFGMISSGWVVSALEAQDQWGRIGACRVIFIAYGGIGLVQLCLTLLLSQRCEIYSKSTLPEPSGEEAPLLSNYTAKQKAESPQLFSQFCRARLRLFITLAVLLGLDAFATSLATISWTSEYFQREFSMATGTLGSLFFIASIISTVSIIAAASLAQHFGNLKTMVFTHLPSSVALAFLGVPHSPPIAVALLMLRASSQHMDMAPRSAFLADILLPEERTMVIGVIGVVKTAVSSLGPIITGTLAERNLLWVTFIAAGILKALYDLSLLWTFRHYQTEQDETEYRGDEADVRPL